jgi:TetR/AcrR family transcriptional repressor of lmrAB and yxaGH operons
MAPDTRGRMVRSAAALFREHGYDGVGFREIVADAGAARGAIYHHFPGGKAELAEEVVRAVGASIDALLAKLTATGDPEATVDGLVRAVSRVLAGPSRPPGCPVAAVALGAREDDRLLDAAGEVYAGWVEAIAAPLRAAGVRAADAEAYGVTAVAALEGALVLSRTQRSTRPLEQVGAQLRRSVRTLLDDC